MSRPYPAVAVVIPTHNRCELLMDALESLHRQEQRPDEVVVVADGCTDGTAAALDGAGFPGLRVVPTPGLGAAEARNAGWRTTGAEVVAFLDDDCRAEPSWLSVLAAGFTDEGVGLVQGRTDSAGPVGPYDRTIRIDSETGLYESCNIAYRRQALEEVGGFRDGFGGGRPFGEDTDLAWRVKRAGWQSRFAAGAVVRHAVFTGTPRTMLAEAWRTARFPYVVREIPELRDRLPGGRWLLRRQSLAAQLALAGSLGAVVSLAAGRRPWAGALVLPYLRWLSTQTHDPASAARLAARDAVVSAALAGGSLRHRSLVL